MLPEDSESVSSLVDAASENTAAQPFAPEQMVRCEECLRANAPTRINCLYCAAVLPRGEGNVKLQKPALRPLEKWECGYNNILLPRSANPAELLTEAQLAAAADLLRIPAEDLGRITASGMRLPIARAATHDEASLVQERLGALTIETRVVSDADLGIDESPPVKIRSMEIDDAGISVFQNPDAKPIRLLWTDLVLLVLGRLVVKRVELKEQKGKRDEKRILDASEFYADESLIELYSKDQRVPYRIAANSFDFSCLAERKGLLAGENVRELLRVLCENAPHAERDDSYNAARKLLDPVWPAEQRNESSGWRRRGPGKYSLGSVTEVSNEIQFLRYSRLRYYLMSGVDKN